METARAARQSGPNNPFIFPAITFELGNIIVEKYHSPIELVL